MGPLGQTQDLKLPTVFGRYLLLRRISRGGMGEIFLARSGQLSGFEKLCVIKKVLAHLSADVEFIRRFIDEAQVAIKLQHANVAQVFEVGMVDGEYFLALEWIDGRDLRRTLSRLTEKRSRMPVDLGLLVLRDVAAGLAYAHRRTDDTGANINLVHCDISPPNVLVAFEGDVKIIDFGIAKSAIRTAETNPKMGFGKYGYMAPEQLVQGGKVDRRTDVYAAGVLLFELLSGRRMFIFPEGADYRQMARIVAQGQHPRPSEIDPNLRALDDLVLKAVAPDPDQRYQTAEELRDALQVALAARSPTLTSDRLGVFMRDLFAEEMVEEHDALRQANQIDLAPYVDELTDGKTETVSFAVAEELGRRLPLTADADTSRPILSDETPASLRELPRRSLAPVVAAGIAGVVLAVWLVLWKRGGEVPTTPAVVAAPAPQPFVVQPMPQPITAVEGPGAPSPSPSPSPSSGPPPQPPAPPHREPRVDHRAPPRPPPAIEPVKADEAPSADSVQAKYQELARDYGAFKKAYGQRLDAEWNDILELVTYGGGDDKAHKLDARLNQFKKHMAQVKAGGI